MLPYDPAEFRRRSVVDRPGDWGAAFDRVVEEARASGQLVVLGLSPDSEDAFRTTNEAILDEAARAAHASGDDVCAVAVWDGPYAAAGGDTTHAFVEAARRRGVAVRTVPILYRRRYDEAKSPPDDVIDDIDHLPDDAVLRDALRACLESIAPEYVRSDGVALSMQRRHQLVVNTSATLGTAAVVVALLQTLPVVNRMGNFPTVESTSYYVSGLRAPCFLA